MFIQCEETPNPLTLKFLPGEILLDQGTLEFKSADEATALPFVAKLFEIKGITGVLVGNDFLSVTKTQDQEWDIIKPLILARLMDHLTSGAKILQSQELYEIEVSPEDAKIVAEIRELLDTRVRPAVAMDGGDISFAGFEDGIVYVRLKGACSGCPSSSATLKGGIESMLRYYVPEVIAVQEIN